MYAGWRGKIGYIIPSAGAGNFHTETSKTLPNGVTAISTLSYIDKITAESLKQYADQMVFEAKKLKSAEVDVIVAAGTPASLYVEGFDQSLIKKIQDETGIITTTSITSALEALRHFAAKNIAVGTAYRDEINKDLESFLSSRGFHVTAMKGLGVLRNVEGTKLPESTMYRLGKEVIKMAPESDAIFMLGAVPVLDIIQTLEDDTRKPVITSRASEIWAPLRILGIQCSLKGFGRLLGS